MSTQSQKLTGTDPSQFFQLMARTAPPLDPNHWQMPIDIASYTRFAMHFTPRLYDIAYGACGDATMAADAIQDTLHRLLKEKQVFQSYAHVQNWLIRVVRQRLSTIQRTHREQRLDALPELSDPADAIHVPVERAELVQAVRVAIGRLSDRQALAVELSLDGKTQEQIALEMGCSRSTIGSHLRIAYSKLERMFRQQGLAPALAMTTLAGMSATAKCTATQAATILATAWQRAADPAVKLAPLGWTVAHKWLFGVAILAVVSGGGLALTLAIPAPQHEPQRKPQPILVQQPKLEESLEAKNRRLFDAIVRPKLLAALEAMAPADSTVHISEVQAFQTRIAVNAEIRSAIAMRFWLAFDVQSRDRLVLVDLFGTGQSFSVHDGDTIVIGTPNYSTRKYKLTGLTAVCDALAELPKDARGPDATVGDQANLAIDLKAHAGNWKRTNGPAGSWRIDYREPKVADGMPWHVTWGPKELDGSMVPWLAIWRGADGRVRIRKVDDRREIVLSKDGSRIDGPNGEIWMRTK